MKSTNIKEFFSIGGDTEVTINAHEKSRFMSNIDVEDTQKSKFVNEFLNTVKDDIQISSDNASKFVAVVENRLLLTGVNCDNITINDFKQTNESDVSITTELDNDVTTEIENMVAQSITRNIKKNVPKNMINDILDRNNQAMETFLSDAGIDMAELKDLAAKTVAAASSSGIGNDVEVNINETKDTALENTLGISNTQLNESSDKTKNTMISEIKNIASNSNEASLILENVMQFTDVTCKKMELVNVTQENNLHVRVKSIMSNKTEINLVQSFRSDIENTFEKLYQDYNEAASGDNPHKNLLSDSAWKDLLAARLENLEAIQAGLYMAIVKPWEDKQQEIEDADAAVNGRQPKNKRIVTSKVQDFLAEHLGEDYLDNDGTYTLKTETELDTEDEDTEDEDTEDEDTEDDDDETEEKDNTTVSSSPNIIEIIDKLLQPPYIYVLIGLLVFVFFIFLIRIIT